MKLSHGGETYSGTRRIWTPVKGNATDALAALLQAQKTANAVAVAGAAKVEVVLNPVRIPLRDSYWGFVKAAEDRGSPSMGLLA
jgi:hypothetical protein